MSVGPSSERNQGFEAYARNIRLLICIGSTPTFYYFDFYLNTAYEAHYVYFTLHILYRNVKYTGTYMYPGQYLYICNIDITTTFNMLEPVYMQDIMPV